MADTRLEPVVLSEAERRTLENWVKRRSTAQGLAQRARIVLACADGRINVAVAARLRIDRRTVARWRGRFLELRLDGLTDDPRPGVPRSITDAQVEDVVVRTLEEVPEGSTHWPTRELARKVGISATSVQQIWRAFGLQPWRTETFKVSPDPVIMNVVPKANPKNVTAITETLTRWADAGAGGSIGFRSGNACRRRPRACRGSAPGTWPPSRHSAGATSSWSA
jgi:transposase